MDLAYTRLRIGAGLGCLRLRPSPGGLGNVRCRRAAQVDGGAWSTARAPAPHITLYWVMTQARPLATLAVQMRQNQGGPGKRRFMLTASV